MTEAFGERVVSYLRRCLDEAGAAPGGEVDPVVLAMAAVTVSDEVALGSDPAEVLAGSFAFQLLDWYTAGDTAEGQAALRDAVMKPASPEAARLGRMLVRVRANGGELDRKTVVELSRPPTDEQASVLAGAGGGAIASGLHLGLAALDWDVRARLASG